MANEPLELTEEERKVVSDSLGPIREVLKRRNINIKNIIGLVTTDQIEETSKQVEVRFAEKTATHVVMNMVAFD